MRDLFVRFEEPGQVLDNEHAVNCRDLQRLTDELRGLASNLLDNLTI